MSLTESEKNRLYYQKHREHICEVKCEYQKQNKEKIAQQRKVRRTTKVSRKAVLMAEQNVAQTRTWWGKP